MNRLTSLLGVAILGMSLTLGGCFGSGSFETTASQVQTARIATKLGVQIAVLQYVGEDADRAVRVRSGVQTIKALVNEDETLDLFEVQRVVNNLIDDSAGTAGLSPTQVLLLKNAATLIVTDIELFVPTGVLDAEAKERVNFYLDAVIDAVTLVIGPEEA